MDIANLVFGALGGIASAIVIYEFWERRRKARQSTTPDKVEPGETVHLIEYQDWQVQKPIRTVPRRRPVRELPWWGELPEKWRSKR